MSFLLWNTIPDDELMRAADAGELTQDDTLREQLDRMIAHPRFEDGVRAFFTDMWTLYQLDDMTKDPTVFTHMSPEVGEFGIHRRRRFHIAGPLTVATTAVLQLLQLRQATD